LWTGKIDWKAPAEPSNILIYLPQAWTTNRESVWDSQAVRPDYRVLQGFVKTTSTSEELKKSRQKLFANKCILINASDVLSARAPGSSIQSMHLGKWTVLLSCFRNVWWYVHKPGNFGRRRSKMENISQWDLATPVRDYDFHIFLFAQLNQVASNIIKSRL
jgi:hypothetical protein